MCQCEKYVKIYSKKSSKNVFQSIHGPTSTTLEQWPAVSNVPPTLSSTFLQREPRCSTCPSALPLPRAKKYFKKNTEAKAPLQKHILTSSVRPLPSLFCRPGGGFYQLQSPSSSSAPQDPRQHTQQPIVTGEAYCALFDYFSLLIFHNQELL